MSEVVPLTRDSRVLVVGRYKRAPEPEKRTAIVFRVPHIPDGLSPCCVFLQGNNNHRKQTSNSPSGGQIDLFCCAQTCDAYLFFFSSHLCDVVHAKSDRFLVCYSRGIGRVCFPGLHYFGEGSTTSRHWYASNSICNRVWGIRNMQSGHVRVTLSLTHRVSVTAGLLPTDLHCLTLRVVNSLPLGL